MAITAHFIADFSDFTGKVTDAEHALEGMTAQTQKIGNVTAEFGGIASSVFGAVAGGVAAAFSVGQVIEFGQQIMEDADALTRMSDQTGIGVEQLQRLKAVASESGNSVEQLTGAVSTMQNRIAEGNADTVAGLKRIGITIDELRNKSPDEQFYAIAKGIQAIEDPAERARTAIEVFGKAGAQILPSLRADVDAISEGATVMSENTVKKLDELGDAWERLRDRVKAAVANMLIPDQTADQQLEAMKRRLQKIKEIEAGALPDTLGLELASQLRQPEALTVPGLPSPERMRESDAILKELTASTREEAAAAKAAQAEADRFTESMGNLNLAGEGWRTTLDTINGAVVEAGKYYLEMGASQKDLAEVYDLTGQQVEAIAIAYEHERDAMIQASREQEQIAALELQLQRTVADGSSKTTERVIADVWRRADAEIASYEKSGNYAAEMYDLVWSKASATVDNIIRKSLEMDRGTVDYYERLATEAQSAYDFALAHAERYTQGRIDQLRLEAEAAQETLLNWRDVAEQSLSGVSGAADQAAAAIGRVSDGINTATKAAQTFKGTGGLPGSAWGNQDLVSQGGLSGYIGKGPIGAPSGMIPVTGASGFLGYAPINASGNNPANHITVASGAVQVNYPIMNDPQALDQVTRLVGDGVMSRLTRAGGRY